MAKQFDYMKRSIELMRRGLSGTEIAEALDREQEEADVVVLDDAAWQQAIDDIVGGAEERYQADLASAKA